MNKLFRTVVVDIPKSAKNMSHFAGYEAPVRGIPIEVSKMPPHEYVVLLCTSEGTGYQTSAWYPQEYLWVTDDTPEAIKANTEAVHQYHTNYYAQLEELRKARESRFNQQDA